MLDRELLNMCLYQPW